MRMFKKEEGFTLVELMVVVLIIGILVAIAIPVFNSVQKNARGRACQSNQRTIDGAVTQWVAADTGRLASTLIGDVDATHLLLAPTGTGEEPYLAEVPTDPADSTLEYSLIADGTNGAVVDGCPNTTEDHEGYR